jgi:peptidoglycan hydrolase-like protein with peptidoglycan-binding domain
VVPTTTAAAHHASISKKSPTRKPVTVARRSTQQQPTLDRYREIQQALADRGYFAGSPDGNWSSESVIALKRFQRDQNLVDDGKIGSLSLIAMGLGPHRPVPIEAPTVEVAPAPEKSAEKSPGLSQRH